VSGRESRERLLAAAKALRLSQGDAGTTVDSICEKAGLTKGSFTRFFKSKEMLGLSVLEWSLQKSGEIPGAGAHTATKVPLARALAFMRNVEACAVELWSNGCLVTVFDALHDMGDPVGASRHIRQSLR
jgi:AcrR family transcriptional regulator